MKKFKCGDWVVNEKFNEYPFQLINNEETGLFYRREPADQYLTKKWPRGCHKELADTLDKPIRVVSILENCIGGGGYLPVTDLRRAKKRDMNKLLELCQANFDAAKADLLVIKKAIK